MADTVEKKELEATEAADIGILKLRKPIEIDGELTSEIAYDFESLTGDDVARAVKTLTQNGIQVMVAELDTNYHAAIFAQAAGIDYLDVRRFGLKDFTKACSLVRDFFLEE